MQETKEAQEQAFEKDPKAQALQNRLDAMMQVLIMPPPLVDGIVPMVNPIFPSPELQEEYQALLQELTTYKKKHYSLLVDETDE